MAAASRAPPLSDERPGLGGAASPLGRHGGAGLPDRADFGRLSSIALSARGRSGDHSADALRPPRTRPIAGPGGRAVPCSNDAAGAADKAVEGRVLELQRPAGNAAVSGLFVQRHGGIDLTSHTVTEAAR